MHPLCQAGSFGGAGLVKDSEMAAARVNRHKAEHAMMGERELLGMHTGVGVGVDVDVGVGVDATCVGALVVLTVRKLLTARDRSLSRCWHRRGGNRAVAGCAQDRAHQGHRQQCR